MEEIKVEVSNDDLYQGEDKDDLYTGLTWEDEYLIKQVSRLFSK